MNLAEHFEGVAVKRLSEVEVNPHISNQHELNGVSSLRTILGDDRQRLECSYIYLQDNPEDIILHEDSFLTWYDAREANPLRTEYRLYYQPNSVISSASSNDLMVFAKRRDGHVFIIIAPQNSTSERQLLWLFNFEETETQFNTILLSDNTTELGFAAKYILSTIGIEETIEDNDLLERTVERFNGIFPNTREFSSYARSFCGNYREYGSSDIALLEYLKQEEKMFRLLENHIVAQKLVQGFGQQPNVDVDGFIKYSLSVQNRRKSRAGHSFENHLEYIFQENELEYSRGKETERKNKPDFIFPGINQYQDRDFNTNLLTMLGAKTSAKDRWRQILQEAERIEQKHLITLEPAISENQTAEMIERQVQLVIPAGIQETYTNAQRQNILSFDNFLEHVSERQ